MRSIAKRIRELREQLGLSQGEVEQRTGMLRAYISRVEHGHTVPSLETIERFAAVFGVPLYEMFRPAKNGQAASRPNDQKDSPFLSALTGYVRDMNVADREVVIQVATRLAQRAQE